MIHQSEELTIESRLEPSQLVVRWRGRSETRDPSRTLAPILEAVTNEISSAPAVEFDFRPLEYMNSSSIRPILKLVQAASTRTKHVRVLYDSSKHWQRLSFAAIGAVLASLGNVEVSA